MIGDIAKKWKLLSGEEKWKNLLDPLDLDLRRYILHYGNMAEATYDTFNNERASKYEGSSHYSKKNMFSMVGLAVANPYQYKPIKYLYATSQIEVPELFILRPSAREAWCKESNWIGYVAVATDEGKVVLGRRDILIAWRGSVRAMEWINDFNFPLVSASSILGDANDPKVHKGWFSIYTSANQESLYNKTSAREQVLSEVKRLVNKYKEEEISITIAGHSLGAALGTLSAADIVVNGFNRIKGIQDKFCPVTAFLFASPRVGDSNFRDIMLKKKNLHLLRVSNAKDIIPHCPPTPGYTDVGQELIIDTQKSNYLKSSSSYAGSHDLEVYLHGVAGTQGPAGEFKLEVKRDIALVNKRLDAVKDDYLVPVTWWCMKNKGMVQLDDGSWKLDDHEKDDYEP